MSSPSDTCSSDYIVATSELLALPLDAEQHARVTATFARSAAFAIDVATIALGNEIEIAGAE